MSTLHCWINTLLKENVRQHAFNTPYIETTTTEDITIAFILWIAWFYPNTSFGGLNLPQNTIGRWWRHQMEAFSSLLALCAGNSLMRTSMFLWWRLHWAVEQIVEWPVIWKYMTFKWRLRNKNYTDYEHKYDFYRKPIMPTISFGVHYHRQ